MDKIRTELDNPLVLLVLVTLGVFSLGHIFKWWSNAMHHNGASQLFGGKIGL